MWQDVKQFVTIDIGYMEFWTTLQGLTFHLFSVPFVFFFSSLNKFPKRKEPFLSKQKNATAIPSRAIYQMWASTEEQTYHMKRDIMGLKETREISNSCVGWHN